MSSRLNDDPEFSRAFGIWLSVLAAAWLIGFCCFLFQSDLADNARASAWTQMRHSIGASFATCSAICIVPVLGLPAYGIAAIHVRVARRLRLASAQRALKRLQCERADEIERADRRLAAQEHQEHLAVSRKRLVQLLGGIDQYTRVLGHETDEQRRVTALLAAQDIALSIQAGIASGEIGTETLADPVVIGHARETCADLARIGLAQDRVTRDLVRIFQLSVYRKH